MSGTAGRVIDLHTHSTASDGGLAPEALVREAARLGLSALALTDHDTTAGLAAAAREAAALGLAFIPGIELEIRFPEVSGEFHLLGLGLWNPSADFLAAVEELAQERERRNRAILALMRERGIAAEWEDIAALSGGHSIGRLHFASFLVKRRVVRNHEQAFKRYLGKGMPLYVPRAGLEFDRAVQVIHESGGAASLAHPRSLHVSWGRLPGLLAGLKERGLDCVEAWHPTATPAAARRIEALARNLRLGVTAGSDFHGSARPGRKLGRTSGGLPIRAAFLDALPQPAGPAERGFVPDAGCGEIDPRPR